MNIEDIKVGGKYYIETRTYSSYNNILLCKVKSVDIDNGRIVVVYFDNIFQTKLINIDHIVSKLPDGLIVRTFKYLLTLPKKLLSYINYEDKMKS